MDTSGFGGHKKIYADLLKRLASADIARLAEHLNLPINNTGEAEIPFLGQTYLIFFYDKDDEFPARATLLLDANATQLIDFEALAVSVTIFVRFLTETEVSRSFKNIVVGSCGIALTRPWKK